LEDTLDYILQQSTRLLGPSAVAVFELTPSGKEMRLRASSGLPQHFAPSGRIIPLDNNPFEMAVRQRDARMVSLKPPVESVDGMDVDGRFACALIVPLLVRELPHGLLALYYCEEHKYSDEDLALALALADQAALAIENGSMRARERQVAAATERSRLARELHDSVSQALFGIALGARTIHTLLPTANDPKVLAAPLDYILQLAEGGIAEMRSLIFELRPESLESEGIVAGFRKHAAALQSRYNINVTTDFDEEPRLPIDLKESLYRIGVEAMHNTVKHAKASQIHLSLHLSNTISKVILQITDNGIGFKTDQQFPGHLGLQSMRERMEQFQGTLVIDSAPNQGTTIRVEIPFPIQTQMTKIPVLDAIPTKLQSL
jgi:signal transduction histidine kinase